MGALTRIVQAFRGVFLGESRNKNNNCPKNRDEYGYPLRGYDVYGPPPRPRSFEDYMKDETFLDSLPPIFS